MSLGSALHGTLRGVVVPVRVGLVVFTIPLGETTRADALDEDFSAGRRVPEQRHSLAYVFGQRHGVWIFRLKSPGKFGLNIRRDDLQHFHWVVAQLIAERLRP